MCLRSRGPGPADLSFCCFGPFCGRGRPQDLVERVGFEISCRNQGSLPSGSGSKAIFEGGGPPRGSFLCHTKKWFMCSPAVPEINILNFTQLYLKTLFVFSLPPSPLPRGCRWRVRIDVFLQEPGGWAGPRGCNFDFDFHVDL